MPFSNQWRSQLYCHVTVRHSVAGTTATVHPMAVQDCTMLMLQIVGSRMYNKLRSKNPEVFVSITHFITPREICFCRLIKLLLVL